MNGIVESLGYLPGGRTDSGSASSADEPTRVGSSGPAVGLNRPRMIALLGIAAGSRNQGVQALAASLVSLCVGGGRKTELYFLSGNSHPMCLRYRVGDRDYDVQLVNYRVAPTWRLNEHLFWIVAMAMLYRVCPLRAWRRAIARHTPWIDVMSRCDGVADIRGGDSFSDIYGWKRFMTGFLAAWSAILVKGGLIQLPQTYGPFKSALARLLARYLLRRSTLILARDRQSQQVAQDLVGGNQTVRLCPDVAFSMMARKPTRIITEPALTGVIPSGIIGINVNGLMYRGGYTRANMFGLKLDYPEFLKTLIESIMRHTDSEIWLVPHTYGNPGDVESDPEAARCLWLGVGRQPRVRMIAPEYGCAEIKGVIGHCDFFIGSRMHACVAALSQGIPCVGVAYSRKFAGVFETVGMEDWVIDARVGDNAEAVARVMGLYARRDSVRAPLRRAAHAAQDRLADVIDELGPQLGMMTRRAPAQDRSWTQEAN